MPMKQMTSLQNQYYLDLSYVKEILTKVSFDQKLFEKELKKAVVKLTPSEVQQLRSWCYQQFARDYNSSIHGVFANFSY